MVYDDQDNRGGNAIMQLVMIDNNHYFTTEWGKIVPGQNDTFAPVVPRVPGQISRCPCGVGAYAGGRRTLRAFTDKPSDIVCL